MTARGITTEDTIVALATPPGVGGVAIVRISGPDAARILACVFAAADGRAVGDWPSHQLTYGHVVEAGQPVDEAMAVLMRAPRSYTHEDVAEVHSHGGAWVRRRVVQLAVAAGARVAEPGEFTRRAFAHGRIDLAQAEAVMRLVSAEGEQAARAAMQQLSGGVSRFVLDAREKLTALLAGLEAALDFPDEVDEAEAVAGLTEGCLALAEQIESAADPRAGKLLREGLDVAIAGRPNVGKSTLLNALLGEARAIVTDVPGTTRDTLTERITLDGAILQLTDTAGLRNSGDAVEAMGITRAQAALARADLWLLVLDASRLLAEEDRALLTRPCDVPRIVALNKGDLPAMLAASDIHALCPDADVVSIAAQTGAGIDALKEKLAAHAGVSVETGASLSEARHIDAARQAAKALYAAAQALREGLPLDIAAVDLRDALHALGSITGETLDENVLDAVFATFCVGK